MINNNPQYESMKFYLNSETYRNRNEFLQNITGLNWWHTFMKVSRMLIASLYDYVMFSDCNFDITDKVIAFGDSENQTKAIHKLLPSNVVVCGSPRKISNKLNNYEKRLYLNPNSRIRILRLNNYIRFYIRKIRSKEIPFRNSVFWFIEGIGYYESWFKILNESKPLCIIVANDHSVKYRSLVEAANNLGICSIFIQHASTAKDFPELRARHSLLYSMIDKRIYKQAGFSNSQISIIGIPILYRLGNRDLHFVSNYFKDKITCAIGIATNKTTNLRDLDKLIRILRTAGYENLILRRHPADERIFHSQFIKSYSKGKVDTFITEINVLITSVSGIVLEAACLGVPSILSTYLSPEKTIMLDLYQYTKYGICNISSGDSNLLHQLDTIEDIHQSQQNSLRNQILSDDINDPIETVKAILESSVRSKKYNK